MIQLSTEHFQKSRSAGLITAYVSQRWLQLAFAGWMLWGGTFWLILGTGFDGPGFTVISIGCAFGLWMQRCFPTVRYAMLLLSSSFVLSGPISYFDQEGHYDYIINSPWTGLVEICVSIAVGTVAAKTLTQPPKPAKPEAETPRHQLSSDDNPYQPPDTTEL